MTDRAYVQRIEHLVGDSLGAGRGRWQIRHLAPAEDATPLCGHRIYPSDPPASLPLLMAIDCALCLRVLTTRHPC